MSEEMAEKLIVLWNKALEVGKAIPFTLPNGATISSGAIESISAPELVTVTEHGTPVTKDGLFYIGDDGKRYPLEYDARKKLKMIPNPKYAAIEKQLLLESSQKKLE